MKNFHLNIPFFFLNNEITLDNFEIWHYSELKLKTTVLGKLGWKFSPNIIGAKP